MPCGAGKSYEFEAESSIFGDEKVIGSQRRDSVSIIESLRRWHERTTKIEDFYWNLNWNSLLSTNTLIRGIQQVNFLQKKSVLSLVNL